jgi:hypothetical protein
VSIFLRGTISAITSHLSSSPKRTRRRTN